MPITWQNINMPSNTGVAQMLSNASQGIASGFDKLGSALTSYQNAQEAAVDRKDQGLVLDLKEALSKARTPQEVLALTDQLQGIRSSIVNNKGREAVLGAEDARTTAVQNQITAENAFKAGLRTSEQTAKLAEVNDPVAVAEALAKAARSPTQIAMDNAALTNKANLQPTQLATDVLTTEATNRTARFDASQAGTKESQAIQNARIKANELLVTEGDSKNKVEDQLLQTLIAKESAANQAKLLEGKTTYGQLGLKLGIPLDPAGGPDLSAATPEQRLRLTSAGIMQNLPDLNSLYGGDTKRTNAFVQSLRERGVSPQAIERNLSTINSQFSTINASAPKGNDALAAASAQVRTDVQQEQRDKTNWYTPGKANAKNTYEVLAKQIESMFNKDSNMAEDLPAIQELLYKAATTGIEVKKGVFLTPSAEDMMAAIRSQMGNSYIWLNNSGRADDIEKYLKKNMTNSRVEDLQAQARESEKASEDRAVRNYLSQAFGYGVPSIPSSGVPIQKK